MGAAATARENSAQVLMKFIFGECSGRRFFVLSLQSRAYLSAKSYEPNTKVQSVSARLRGE